MTTVSTVGGAHSRCGKLDEPDTKDLISLVAGQAIADAATDPADIDAVFVGQFNSGFSKQDFPSSLPMQGVAAPRLDRNRTAADLS